MLHTVKILAKINLYVNSQFFNDNLMSCSVIVVYETFWLKNYYRLTDPPGFSGGYFTETFLFFPCDDISCNFSSICFILGFIFT